MPSELKRFVRDRSGNSVHFHAHGNEGRHNEFVSGFKRLFKEAKPYITINAKIYKASEKSFIQYVASRVGINVRTMNALQTKFSALLDTNENFTCIFVITNVEELCDFKASMLKQFLCFISTHPKQLKLITVSTLPWQSIVSRLLNFQIDFATVVHQLADFTTNELSNMDIPGVSQDRLNPMSIQMLSAYLPKNLNPVFLRKLVASQEPQKDESFQRLPANVALTLVSAYLATWNPSATDTRYFGEKSIGKRRAHIKAVREFHEAEAKQFTIARLKKIYEGMQKSLIANCGNFELNVQVPILLQFGHLERVSDVQNLAAPKFRCSAPFDYVNKIFIDFVKHHTARSVDKTTTEDLRVFLHDYNE